MATMAEPSNTPTGAATSTNNANGLSEAQEALDKAMKMFPQLVKVNVAGREEIRDALLAAHAYPENKDNPTLLKHIGNVYYHLGQDETAAEWFEAAINSKPDFYQAWYNLGATKVRIVNQAEDRIAKGSQETVGTGTSKQAIHALKKAIEIHPAYAKAYKNLAIACSHICKRSSSIEDKLEYGQEMVNAWQHIRAKQEEEDAAHEAKVKAGEVSAQLSARERGPFHYISVKEAEEELAKATNKLKLLKADLESASADADGEESDEEEDEESPVQDDPIKRSAKESGASVEKMVKEAKEAVEQAVAKEDPAPAADKAPATDKDASKAKTTRKTSSKSGKSTDKAKNNNKKNVDSDGSVAADKKKDDSTMLYVGIGAGLAALGAAAWFVLGQEETVEEL